SGRPTWRSVHPCAMARSTSSALTKLSALSTHAFWCSRANCPGTRMRRCRARNPFETSGDKFFCEYHHSTASSSSAKLLTCHNGPERRLPTVEITSINGSSTLACPASKLENSSSSRAHPHSSYTIRSGCRPRDAVCSLEVTVQREPVLGTSSAPACT